MSEHYIEDIRVWWYISFSFDGEFRGAIFVHADSFQGAIAETIRCGAQKGWHPLVANVTGMLLPPESGRERLLSLSELRGMFGDMTHIPIEGDDDDEPLHLIAREDA